MRNKGGGLVILAAIAVLSAVRKRKRPAPPEGEWRDATPLAPAVPPPAAS